MGKGETVRAVRSRLGTEVSEERKVVRGEVWSASQLRFVNPTGGEW